jgi:alpha-glucuronidase
MLATALAARAEDGYRLWLRYDRISDDKLRSTYVAELPGVVLEVPDGVETPALAAAREELTTGLSGLLGVRIPVTIAKSEGANPADGDEGYELRHSGGSAATISANHGGGVLYGAFELLRRIQTHAPIDLLNVQSSPRIQRRILDHWDDLNGFVARGYAGSSLWNWFTLPDIIDPRYRDYARADASVGINGVVLTDVNAEPLALTEHYLVRVAALADTFRPYGIRVYLSVNFSSPIDIGGLHTADPKDPSVAVWWRTKADEIYRLIPDFGGFLVKANSEGQSGPQDYGSTHAEGANLLADALAPHGGIVMWRAFVYDAKDTDDRVKQAYKEFQPLDGKFRDNVVLQIKNGPLDFQPREPFHPLFGAMPHTQLALEVQITQEYLGASVYLVYLAPLFKECLDSDTLRPGPGSTIAKVVDGSLDHHRLSVIAGVSNVGADRDWTGHPMASSNWYAFGRLSWDPALGSDMIAEEWTRQTFSNDTKIMGTITSILARSREAAVHGSMPLGLHHIMAKDTHYGPGPWVTASRPDWTAPYYHHADSVGLGFDRTPAGSDALSQYAPEAAMKWQGVNTCPENLILWFHHIPWDHRMHSGRTLWDELCLDYQLGVDEVRSMQRQWDSLEGSIDDERFVHVKSLLVMQERETREWRDGCILYFQQFSKRPIPSGVEAPDHDLGYYESVRIRLMPGASESK